MSQKVLITGGCGFIGSHVAKKLSRCGFEPISYDNLLTSYKGFAKWGPLIQGDLTDEKKLISVLEKHKPVAVIHLAAYALIRESMQEPGKCFQTNVSGSITLFCAMQKAGIKNLIFASSCSVYGEKSHHHIKESDPTNPITPYGKSKLYIEEILQEIHKAYDFPYMNLRIFNAAGSDQDAEIGEQRKRETHLIPLAIRAALDPSFTLPIFGNRFATKDRSPIRDYVHIEDISNACVLSTKHLLQKKPSQTLNIGSGKGHSLLQVIQAIEQHAKLSVKTKIMNPSLADPSTLIADMQKTKQILDWSPCNSSLEKIIQSALRWHQKLLSQSVL